RRGLYGLYRNPHTDDASVKGAAGRSAANTTPVFHAGRLLATKEDGRPVELDPRTLETLGAYDLRRPLRSATTPALAGAPPPGPRPRASIQGPARSAPPPPTPALPGAATWRSSWSIATASW